LGSNSFYDYHETELFPRMGQSTFVPLDAVKAALAASLMMEYVLQLLQRERDPRRTGTILLKVGSGGLAFAMFSLAARTMSPDAFGLFATWLCIAQIASVVGLVGQELVLVRFLTSIRRLGERPEQRRAAFLHGGGSDGNCPRCSGDPAAGASGANHVVAAVRHRFHGCQLRPLLGSQIARSLVTFSWAREIGNSSGGIWVVTSLLGLLLGHSQISPAEMFMLRPRPC